MLVAPLLAGLANIQALGREFPDLALLAHPTMGGAARIAPEVLIGQVFPLVGADAVIFPNYGGRFGYSETRCRAIAEAARGVGALPVPAGGMTLARVPELLGFYGADVMLLIGGSYCWRGTIWRMRRGGSPTRCASSHIKPISCKADWSARGVWWGGGAQNIKGA